LPVTFFQGQPHLSAIAGTRPLRKDQLEEKPSFWFRVGMRRARPCHLRHVDALELSNNLAENAMRPVALGRRNWMYIGSEQAGPRVAAIVSVIEPADDLRFRSASIFARSCQALLISQSIGSARSRPVLGGPETKNPEKIW
jgi:hypothetical protein